MLPTTVFLVSKRVRVPIFDIYLCPYMTKRKAHTTHSMSAITATSSKPAIYGMYISAGCRLALWTASISEVQVDFKSVDLMLGENKQPEFVELTRGRHCIPALSHVLSDGTSFSMTESRSIARYLSRIGNGKICVNFERRPDLTARVEEWLDYDGTCLYKRVGAIAYHRLYQMYDAPQEKDFEILRKSLHYIQDALRSQSDPKYLVGETLSIADIVVANTLSMLSCVPEIDLEIEFPFVDSWLVNLLSVGGLVDYNEIVGPFREFASTKVESK